MRKIISYVTFVNRGGAGVNGYKKDGHPKTKRNGNVQREATGEDI